MLYRWAKRSVFGLIAYFGLNLLLIAQEPYFHFFTRIATYDLAMLKGILH